MPFVLGCCIYKVSSINCVYIMINPQYCVIWAGKTERQWGNILIYIDVPHTKACHL